MTKILKLITLYCMFFEKLTCGFMQQRERMKWTESQLNLPHSYSDKDVKDTLVKLRIEGF